MTVFTGVGVIILQYDQEHFRNGGLNRPNLVFLLGSGILSGFSCDLDFLQEIVRIGEPNL